MDGDRITQAIARIEAATGRISAASEALSVDGVGDPELATKHEALRKEVSQALSNLDQIIGRLES